ncbi:hypothetical protein ACFFX0_12900 [Citricoccus parietis]|uniref:Uncharacterized protein n=1 Tax=Citricoccus parietis TaxID=592307 RepID=A0ABV5FZE6_9MICC
MDRDQQLAGGAGAGRGRLPRLRRDPDLLHHHPGHPHQPGHRPADRGVPGGGQRRRVRGVPHRGRLRVHGGAGTADHRPDGRCRGRRGGRLHPGPLHHRTAEGGRSAGPGGRPRRTRGRPPAAGGRPVPAG